MAQNRLGPLLAILAMALREYHRASLEPSPPRSSPFCARPVLEMGSHRRWLGKPNACSNPPAAAAAAPLILVHLGRPPCAANGGRPAALAAVLVHNTRKCPFSLSTKYHMEGPTSPPSTRNTASSAIPSKARNIAKGAAVAQFVVGSGRSRHPPGPRVPLPRAMLDGR